MNRLATTLAFVGMGVSGLSGPATADDRGRGDAVFDPLTMDRHTPISTFGIDLGYVVFDEPPATNLSAIGVTVAGHYVDQRTGFGGYLSLPLSYVDVETVLFDDSELAVGNIEAGGMFSKWFGPHSAVVIHGGIAFPTADDDGAGALQSIASSPRYGDLVERWPNSTWLRLGVSGMGRSGQLFWRADLGLDLAIDDDNAVGISPVLRLNIGGGIDLGSAQLLAELVTDVVDDNSSDESASMLAVGARFDAGNLRPGVALQLPLGLNETFDVDLAIVASLAARL